MFVAITIEDSGLRSQLPDVAKRWLDDLTERFGEAAETAVADAADGLASEYLAGWGASLPPGAEGARYRARVAMALVYHWRRFAQHEPDVDLNTVIARVRAGRLAFGRFRDDVLRDVALAQGVRSGDPDAMRTFQTEYQPVVEHLVRRLGDPWAEHELEGFTVELALPRGHRPCRLDGFLGLCPMRAWLRRVVRNAYLTRVGRRGHESASIDSSPEVAAAVGEPDDGVAGDELVGRIVSLFRRALGSIEDDRVRTWSQVEVEGAPQNVVACRLRVHKSTISRHCAQVTKVLRDAVRRDRGDLADSYLSMTPDQRRRVAYEVTRPWCGLSA
ncbi:MAG: RNA polymerase sigma factor [Isosphaeraceae bacterium]